MDLTNAEKFRRRLNRTNELPLLYACMAFQCACMLLLAFRDGYADAFSLRMAALLPLCTFIGLRFLIKIAPVDRCIYIIVAFLCSLGVILLRAVYKSTNSASEQAMFLPIGYAALIFGVVLVRRLRSWDKFCLWLMPVCLIALCLPFAFGSANATAKSWVRIGGAQFQPSELIKPVMIVILASGFSSKRGFSAWWLYAAFGAAMCGILFLQPDLGCVFLYFATVLAMFYIGTGSKKTTLLVLAVAVGGVIVFLSLLDKISAFKYLASRIAIWQNPWSNAYEDSRQIVQGLISIASGGAFGAGLGLGSADRVAVVGSDYIFAALSEEFGIIFALCALAMFLILFRRGMSAAMNARSRFHALIAFGCAFELAVQMLLIVCGNLHIIPLTGVTLPFVSAGGSSLVASMGQAGLILGVTSVNAQDEYDDLMRMTKGEWREPK